MSEISFLRLGGLNHEIDLSISSIFSEDVNKTRGSWLIRVQLVHSGTGVVDNIDHKLSRNLILDPRSTAIRIESNPIDR